MNANTKVKSKNFFKEIALTILSCVVIYYLTAENTITIGNGGKVVIGEVHRKQILYTIKIHSSSFKTIEEVAYSRPELINKVESKLRSLCHWSSCNLSKIAVDSEIKILYISSRFPQGYRYTLFHNFNFTNKVLSPAVTMKGIIKELKILENYFEDTLDVD